MVKVMKVYNRIPAMFFASVLMIAASCACDSSSGTLPPQGGNGGMVKPDMSQIYNYVRSYQLAYIRSLQLPTGALKDNGSDNSKITPYFAHFAMMALLTDPTEQNQDAVRKYMLWYFSRLNGAKTLYNDNEIAGSVYDYFAPDETTKGTYDSVDSYAATFLELALRFAEISDANTAWLRQYSGKVSMIADAMLKTIDAPLNVLPGGNQNDYLSIAHYGYPVKYLMDNSEVNMGLKAAVRLGQYSIIDVSADLETFLSKNTEAIKGLYNGVNRNYDYAKGNESDWNVFYPGATAQLYPALFRVVSPLEINSKQIYEKFNSTYPEWHTGKVYCTYPWTMIAYAAAVMGDKERVDTYITHIYGLNVKNEQKAYWYDAEAASLVLAIDEIRNED